MDAQRDKPATKKDLDQVKQELTAKIDANSGKIEANGRKIDRVEQKLIAKIDANSAKIDANGRKIDANGKKIDANSATLSRVSHQVVENHEQIGRLLSMSEKFKEYFDEIISTLDGLASGFAQLNQERMVMNTQLDRVERDVAKNKTDIKKIKTKLATP